MKPDKLAPYYWAQPEGQRLLRPHHVEERTKQFLYEMDDRHKTKDEPEYVAAIVAYLEEHGPCRQEEIQQVFDIDNRRFRTIMDSVSTHRAEVWQGRAVSLGKRRKLYYYVGCGDNIELPEGFEWEV